jgi:hypothetical protein
MIFSRCDPAVAAHVAATVRSRDERDRISTGQPHFAEQDQIEDSRSRFRREPLCLQRATGTSMMNGGG